MLKKKADSRFFESAAQAKTLGLEIILYVVSFFVKKTTKLNSFIEKK